jgi:hypothetical protein
MDKKMPEENYILPENFDIEVYKNSNHDLTHFQYPELISHYLTYGKHENRIFSMDKKMPNVVGYFHICQKDHWHHSFDIIMKEVKESGLYDVTSEIRCGVLSDGGCVIPDVRLDDPKIKIVVDGHSSLYERPTLLHMRTSSETDPPNTSYWYVHTKGLRHFGTATQENVIDWINLMLYWNINKWRMALQSLVSYNIYGCNGVVFEGHLHYSGNFWWANSSYIKTLPNFIGELYTDPEFWICLANPKMCDIYTNNLAGGKNYRHRLAKHCYEIPENFDVEIYKNSNDDLIHFQYPELIWHFLTHGKHENRIFS